MASDLPVAVATSMPARSVPARIWAMPVGVVINGRSLSETGLVVQTQGQLFVRGDMPGQWGLRLPDGLARIRVDGADYASLEGVPGLSARLDGGGATLLIDAEPSLFSATHFGTARHGLPVMEAISAQYVGYDLSLSRWSGKWAASVLLDAGASGDWGVIGTTALLQRGMDGPGAVRLDSNFIRDFPDRRLRLTLGDTVTRGGDWNRPVRFAGIRLGTDFALTPDDITYPLPRLSGSSTLPSVVELAAVSSRQSMAVQPGDFAIDYQPVFTGAGEVTMTVRDANGAARTVTQSFYTSPRLLREGIDDFSLEAGVPRRDFGGSSFAYGAPFAAGFWRHGLGDGLTLAGRAEASGDVRMAGLGLGAILSSWGEVTLSMAGGQSRWGTGLLWRAQVQRITSRYSVTASYMRQDAAFVQVGVEDPLPGKRRELIVAGSLTLGRRGSINADYVENDGDGGYRFATGSLSYAASLGPAWVTLGARRTRFSDSRNNSLFGSLTLPLGTRSNAGLFAQGSRIAASVSQTPPPDSGWGYRFLAARQDGDMSQWEAGATWRTAAGDVDMSMARMAGAGGMRLQAHGALVRAGGQIVATPQLDYAFAVVDVGADQDVTVFFESRPVARKAGLGRQAVVTGLQPYAANRIAIDLDDLPIDAVVTSAEQVAVPGYRQAVAIRFARTSAHPVTLRLVDKDGAPVEQGLTVIVEGAESGVSGHDGEIFLADARAGQDILLTGPAKICRAIVPALPDRSGMTRIAPVPCAPDGEGK
ncbi:fimbria/pilus outer membrane usher protein [Sphingobium sp. JS3065]|uniref:fimbria/pilus outer membrane usher protein n=1 Tax=Sphingobium sp. JS3065 TaxID=2970925 RepID=UPI0022654A47|nr:fimbria/pilus outer membrane usher protein [Sphingobium sp. JS3065]UZW53836.1 fimbria/pilus outer membrane usher protein [Sphingobium sp. JS3065]